MSERSDLPAKLKASEGLLWYLRFGGIEVGERLPSERDLSQLLGVSRTAMRATIDIYVEDNVLERRPGSGTYRAPRKVTNVFQTSYSFTESAEAAGGCAGSRVVYARIARADEKVARYLEVSTGDSVFEMRRVRTIDGKACALESVWLDANRFEGLDKHDFERESLFAVLEEDYGVRIVHGDDAISVAEVRDEEAHLLELPVGAPVYFQKAIERDSCRRPVEYSVTLMRPDRYQFASIDTDDTFLGKVELSWLE